MRRWPPAPPSLVLDLDRVSFLDAAGLGVLIGGLRRARESGGDLVVRRVSRPVKRVFEVTGFDALLAAAAAPLPPGIGRVRSG